MKREPLTMFCYADLSGQVRGKGFPRRLLKQRVGSGVGWTPTNLMITALGPIADSPWGSRGDLILMPDPAAEVLVDFDDDSPAEHFFLCDVLEADGTPWTCCPRQFLRDTMRVLRDAGLVAHVAFEHEFVYSGANERPGDGYALDAIRRHGAFGEVFIAALRQAGVDADSYLPEYGPGQFEVTYPPGDALAAADRAVIVKEMARATASRLGHRVTFAPLVTEDGLGNGVHIHISLRDIDANPVTYDATHDAGLSAVAGSFIAGILRHLPALCAFTAPTPLSYARLKPHRWSAAYNNLGSQDREAGVRICPVFRPWQYAAAEQFNFEFRAADATANPYLQLGMILKAGLAGVKAELPTPVPTAGDPSAMSDRERAAAGIERLPQSLAEALQALDRDSTVQSWLPADLLDACRRYRMSELRLTDGQTTAELCRSYGEVY